MIKGIMNFLFGKDAEIFDQKGNVQHKFSDEKWNGWNARFKENPEFDWRQHSGKTLKSINAPQPIGPVKKV